MSVGDQDSHELAQLAVLAATAIDAGDNDAAVAAGLAGFERAKHLYFTDYSLTITAALRGQGIALGAAAFIATELKTGRLAQMGHTRVPFGEYVLLESNERSTAPVRAAFVGWMDSEIRRR